MSLPKPYYDEDGIVIYYGDCRDILPDLEPVDLVLTDPPYGIARVWEGDTWGAAAKHRSTTEWDAAICQDALDAALRIAGNAIVWGGNYYVLLPSRCWLSWEKIERMQTLSDFELAWTTFDRPSKAWRGRRHTDIPMHPTQKPVRLLQWCLGFAPEATTILDPFMGSGTTLVAAKMDNRKAIGIEIEERYCEIAANRLRQGVFQFEESERRVGVI